MEEVMTMVDPSTTPALLALLALLVAVLGRSPDAIGARIRRPCVNVSSLREEPPTAKRGKNDADHGDKF